MGRKKLKLNKVRYNIYNEDCRKIFGSIPDSSVDLIVTDPPYKITAKGCTGSTGGMLSGNLGKSGKVFEFNSIDCAEYASEFYRVLKDGSHCYVMTNHVNLIRFLNVFTDLRTDTERRHDIKPYGFHFIKSLIWDKGNKITGRFYMSQFEYILFFRKGKGVQINNCGTSDILSIPNKKTKDKNGKNIHDTEKPVELMEILISNSSREQDTVFDPFMGSGTTGIACRNTNRKFIGIEIDKEYFNIAKDRLDGRLV